LSFDFADSCVFSKQSPPPFLCDHGLLREQVPSQTLTHLLPKLRCHYAEFLNQGSLKRLGIFSPPTCVGLRYDHLIDSLEAFLGSMGSVTYSRLRGNVVTSRCCMGFRICLKPPPTGLNQDIQHLDDLPFCVPSSLNANPVVQEY
jgi:hypothetical protein